MKEAVNKMKITGFNHQAFMINSIKKNQQLAIRATEKLVSGKQIHRSGDNPSLILRMSRFESQIRGSQVAQKNIQDGISMTQIASASLDHASQMGQRLRELSVQYQSDTLTEEDRYAIQKEATALLKEMNHMLENTKFNGQKLFNKEEFVIQTGANRNDQYRVTMPKLKVEQAYQSNSNSNMNTTKKEDLSIMTATTHAIKGREDVATLSKESAEISPSPKMMRMSSMPVIKMEENVSNETQNAVMNVTTMSFKKGNGNKGPSSNASPIAHANFNKHSEANQTNTFIGSIGEVVEGVGDVVEDVVDDVVDFVGEIIKGIKDFFNPSLKDPTSPGEVSQPSEPTPNPSIPSEPNQPNEPTNPTIPPKSEEPFTPTNPSPNLPTDKPSDEQSSPNPPNSTNPTETNNPNPTVPNVPFETPEPVLSESPDKFKDLLNPDVIDDKILNPLQEARSQMGIHESILERRLNIEMDKESIISDALSNIESVDVAKEMMNKMKHEMLSYQALTLLHQDLHSRRNNVLTLLS